MTHVLKSLGHLAHFGFHGEKTPGYAGLPPKALAAIPLDLPRFSANRSGWSKSVSRPNRENLGYDSVAGGASMLHSLDFYVTTLTVSLGPQTPHFPSQSLSCMARADKCRIVARPGAAALQFCPDVTRGIIKEETFIKQMRNKP